MSTSAQSEVAPNSGAPSVPKPAAPAQQLDNVILPNGWVVVGRTPLVAEATGSCFSVGYIAEDPQTGRRAFVKALNFQQILERANDKIGALSQAVRAYEYERELCRQCQGMDRVVSILAWGDVQIDPNDALTTVPYLIFEEATSDIRAFMAVSADLDTAWALRTMHNTANGLAQLHQSDIAHQDVKPSNILIFGRDLSKLADLGRACSRSSTGPYDHRAFAGAIPYAPPELLYGQIAAEFNERRLACDVYLLGSMLAFFFTGSSMTALLFQYVPDSARPQSLGGSWSGDYVAALPVIQQAFARALEDFSRCVPEALESELTAMLQALCDPDPKRRGNPRTRGRNNRFELSYFVSKLNALASRAEARVRLRKP